MPDLVVVEQLAKSYRLGDETIRALNGVDLAVPKGRFVAIMGASGSGKTTLLHLVGGLDLPDSGRVTIAGEDLHRMSDERRTLFRRRRMGIVFQAYNLLPTISAVDNVMLPLLVDGQSAGRARERAVEKLRLVHLDHRLSHRPNALSGGEQQRVAIARAIAKRPEVLLCDEPTGALDSKTGIKVIEALLSVNEQLGTTTVIITHNAAIQAVADRVLHFADGRISTVQKNEKRKQASEVTW